MAAAKQSHGIWQIFILVVSVSLWSPDLSSGILSQSMSGGSSIDGVHRCDPALPLTGSERVELLSILKRTKQGGQLIQDYLKSFQSLSTLVIQWDSVSYSQISHPEQDKGRAIASLETAPVSPAPPTVCIHLSKKLPEIEHIADLAHELVHATRLTPRILKGLDMRVDEFVKARIAAEGGEADAFAVECAVKHELLGHWDAFCAPYVTQDQQRVDTSRVVADLFSGTLAASLTGEAYPVMLAKQFKRMSSNRSVNGVRK